MLNFWLEVINSDWAIAALALALVSLFYFRHECIARGYPMRSRLTRGMRVSISVFTLSVGVCLTRAVIYIWRHVFHGAEFSELQTALLLTGGFIGLCGFVCAVREYSKPLYGNWPWIATIAAIFLMTIFNVVMIKI
jgi:hypothetical protein